MVASGLLLTSPREGVSSLKSIPCHRVNGYVFWGHRNSPLNLHHSCLLLDPGRKIFNLRTAHSVTDIQTTRTVKEGLLLYLINREGTRSRPPGVNYSNDEVSYTEKCFLFLLVAHKFHSTPSVDQLYFASQEKYSFFSNAPSTTFTIPRI